MGATADIATGVLTGSLDDALASAAEGRSDLVLVLSGIRLFDGWLPRLVAAARSDSVIATASAMLADGRWTPEPLAHDDIEAAARAVAESSGQLYPRISEPQAGCVLLRRPALDLVAEGDFAQGPTSAAWLADVAERMTQLSLSHVLADDVLAGGTALGLTPQEADAFEATWPHAGATRELDEGPDTPVRHAILVASRGLDRLSVTIDGRSLGPHRAGTQVHALELIAALGRSGAVRLRVVTPPDLHPEAAAVLDSIDDLTTLPYAAAAHGEPPQTDIVHRPSQVFSPDDMTLLLPLGKRIVVTQQDLIAYRSPGYHESVESWARYRRVTRDALCAADRVVFFSEHALADAHVEHLVDPSRATIVPLGADHRVHRSAGKTVRPARMPADDKRYLLCLGAGLRHKNQAFAVRLLERLRAAHEWNGRLVLAGSIDAAFAATLGRDGLGDVLVNLGPVSEPEKAWLLSNAAAVVYPTLYEGFGLLPFEAAEAGVPCLYAAQASLAETVPAQTATLVPWDVAASASKVRALLDAGPERAAHVVALRAAAARYGWDATARALIGTYDDAIVASPNDARRAPRERLALAGRLLEVQHLRELEWQRYTEDLGSDALALVGPDGVLERRDHRPMLALLSRPAARRPVVAVARAAYSLSRSLRR